MPHVRRNDEYRTRLLAEAEAIQRRERQRAADEAALQMSDPELMEVICSGLGLPIGTQFTDEQLQMILDHQGTAL